MLKCSESVSGGKLAVVQAQSFKAVWNLSLYFYVYLYAYRRIMTGDKPFAFAV